MASSPQWKVYSERDEYLASLKYADHAAALVGAIGGTVRYSSRLNIVWREGEESFEASEYWGRAASVMEQRKAEIHQRLAARVR